MSGSSCHIEIKVKDLIVAEDFDVYHIGRIRFDLEA